MDFLKIKTFKQQNQESDFKNKIKKVKLTEWEKSLQIMSAKSLLLFSHSVMSDSPWPLGLQHAWLLCPSPNSHPIDSVMPSNSLVLCHLLCLLPSIFSSIRVFANEEVYTEVSPFLSCARGRRCSSAMTPFSQAGSLSYCVGSCFWSAGPSELACGTNPLCHFQCSRKRHSIPEV